MVGPNVLSWSDPIQMRNLEPCHVRCQMMMPPTELDVPDSVKLLKEVWDSFGAEVIFITSNKQGNDEMMRGCRAGTL